MEVKCVLGWPIFIKRFAKICLIFKSRTVLESSDQMQLKLLKSFFSKSLFKGREIDLKFCTTQKRTLSSPSILFSDTVLVPYRE